MAAFLFRPAFFLAANFLLVEVIRRIANACIGESVLGPTLRLAATFFVDFRLDAAFLLAAILPVGFLLGPETTNNYCYIIR